MILSLPRAKSSHYLKLLLCALLACPSNLPMLEREGTRPEPESVVSTSARQKISVHKPNRKSSRPQADWSVDSDEPEGPSGLDDFRSPALALPQRTRELPSLVPTALDWLPLGPPSPMISLTYDPPLRC
jgi:hypothetical protein